MRMRIKSGVSFALAFCSAACLATSFGNAHAEDASSWRDLETKYIFGFTTGSGIGLVITGRDGQGNVVATMKQFDDGWVAQ